MSLSDFFSDITYIWYLWGISLEITFIMCANHSYVWISDISEWYLSISHLSHIWYLWVMSMSDVSKWFHMTYLWYLWVISLKITSESFIRVNHSYVWVRDNSRAHVRALSLSLSLPHPHTFSDFGGYRLYLQRRLAKSSVNPLPTLVCCSVLQCVAVCSRASHCVAVFYSVFRWFWVNPLPPWCAHTHAWHDSFICVRYDSFIRGTWFKRGFEQWFEWVMSHTYEWVMSHMCVSTPRWRRVYWILLGHTARHCNTLQHTATHCNTLQHEWHQSHPYVCRDSTEAKSTYLLWHILFLMDMAVSCSTFIWVTHDSPICVPWLYESKEHVFATTYFVF